MRISVVTSLMFSIFVFFSIRSINAAQADLGPRPLNGIHDEADVFTDEQEEALARQLRWALNSNNLQVYAVTYRIVKGESIAERRSAAQHLNPQSLRHGGGL